MRDRITEKPLIYFTSVNCDYNQEKIKRPNGLNSEQLMFILDGEGSLVVEGKKYPLYPNTTVFFSKKVSHSYYGHNDSFKTAWITFRGDLLSFLHQHYNIGKVLVCYDVDIKDYICLMRQLQEEYEATARESYMSSIVYRIITEFFSEYHVNDKSAMEMVELYILRNFSKKIYLDELIDISGFSKTKFCKMAKEYWGMTAFDKINDIRLSHAKSMLENNVSLKVSDCAKNSGFDDASYFCLCYRKKYGLSPKSKKTSDI